MFKQNDASAFVAKAAIALSGAIVVGAVMLTLLNYATTGLVV
ncbi:MAG: hypothetical protein AAGC95_05180 [Pseudomonadota bacterium]